MGNRYGRNQKRKAREEIERLSGENARLERMRRQADARAGTAQQQAFEEFIQKQDIYKEAVAECSYALGRALGDELNKHRDALLSLVVKEPLRFEAYRDLGAIADRKVVQVRIPLKDLVYARMV